MSDIWHINNRNKNNTDIPEKENFVVLDGVMGISCLWYGGEEPEPIFWENVKKWCYLDDLLACEQALIDTNKKLDIAVDALKVLDDDYFPQEINNPARIALEQINQKEVK